MKTIGSLKAILLLLTLGVFACIAHADIFVGQPNQELDFTIGKSGYYAVTLSGYIFNNTGSDGVIKTFLNGTNISQLTLEERGWSTGANGSSTVIVSFDAGTTNAITAVTTNATDYSWSYTVQTADAGNCSQALNNLQNQVTALQDNVTDLGTNTAAALAAQNQQLANINTALSTVQAALASNQALTDALSSQITSLQNQIIQVETNNFNALQNQITTLQNTVNQQNAFEQQIFVGTINTPLDFNIIMPGYYDITLDDNLFLTGYAPGAYATLTTSINGAPVLMMSPSIALTDLTISNGSCESTQYFVTGHYTISGDMTFFNLNNNTITNNSIWSYTVKPTK